MKEKNPSLRMRFKVLKTIILKDLKSELKQLSDVFSIFLFGIISIFVFSSAYNFITQNQTISTEIFVIQTWIVVFFIMIFIMAKLLIKEKESGTLGGLISSPISSSMIIVSKTIYCFILLSFIELLLLVFGFFISNPLIQVLNPFQLFNYIILGILFPTFNLSVCGTIVSTFSMYSKNKSFILPILFFPIILPVINPIISINVSLLEGLTFADIVYEFLFLLFHALLMYSILILISDELLSN